MTEHLAKSSASCLSTDYQFSYLVHYGSMCSAILCSGSWSSYVAPCTCTCMYMYLTCSEIHVHVHVVVCNWSSMTDCSSLFPRPDGGMPGDEGETPEGGLGTREGGLGTREGGLGTWEGGLRDVGALGTAVDVLVQ